MLRSAICLALWTTPVCSEPLAFVALAAVHDLAGYDGFLSAVAPVWERHGMRPVLRLTPDEPLPGGTNDITVIAATNRTEFQAYLADPEYRRIAGERVAAVSALTILEGPGPPAVTHFELGTQVSVVLSEVCASRSAGIAISLVAPVDGSAPPYLRGAGCMTVLSADDAPGLDALFGFTAIVRRPAR